jgi:hypothetical protein
MPSSSPLAGDELLAAVSASMAAFHAHHHGRSTHHVGPDVEVELFFLGPAS